MKHAIETKGWMGLGLVLGAGMALGTPVFSQRTSEATRERGLVIDLSDDLHEQPGYVGEVSWQATPIADPAHAGGEGNVIEDSVTPYAPSGASFAGPVQDAGTIVVDLAGSQALELELSFEVIARLADPRTATKTSKQRNTYRLKLSGGEPLQPAAILVRNDLPAGGGKRAFLAGASGVQGVFEMDGTFVVELPDDVLRHGPLFAQGFALSGGDSGTQILQPKPSKKLRMQMNGVDGFASADVVLESEASGVSWSAEPIADAVHGMLDKTPAGKRTKARFLGKADYAGLDEIVDVTVELQAQPQGGGFTLRLGEDLAERTGLVSPEDEGTERKMHFATVDELAQAVMDVALIDAFSAELDVAVSWSAESLADARVTLEDAYAQSQSIRRDAPGGRPARSTQKFARQSGPTNLVERTIELEADTAVGVQAGNASGIGFEPHAAKKPARPAKKSAARFDGTLGEGGDVTVRLGGPVRGHAGNETVNEASGEVVVLAAQTFQKHLRETRELEAASRTLEIKRDNLKRKLARP